MTNIVAFPKPKTRRRKERNEATTFNVTFRKTHSGVEYEISGVDDSPESLTACASILSTVAHSLKQRASGPNQSIEGPAAAPFLLTICRD